MPQKRCQRRQNFYRRVSLVTELTVTVPSRLVEQLNAEIAGGRRYTQELPKLVAYIQQ